MSCLLFLFLLAVAIVPIFIVRQRHRSDALSGSQTAQTNPAGTGAPLTFIVAGAALVLGVVLLLMVVWFFYTIFRWPALARLREAEQLAAVLANIAVLCYAFPAFLRTKRRPFLALGFAALLFAYGVLFSMSLSSPATARWRTTHSEARWYYASQHIVAIIALLLYAYAGASLARQANAPEN